MTQPSFWDRFSDRQMILGIVLFIGLVVVHEFGFVCRHVHIDRAVPLAPLAGETEVQGVPHSLAAPAIADGPNLHGDDAPTGVAAEILEHHRRQRQRQPLPAMLHRSGERAPAALDIGAIGRAIAIGHRDAFRRPFGADLVSEPAQRREFALGEGADSFEDRIDGVGRSVGKPLLPRQLVQLDDMLEQEPLVGDRCCVGHGWFESPALASIRGRL